MPASSNVAKISCASLSLVRVSHAHSPRSPPLRYALNHPSRLDPFGVPPEQSFSS
jgi:hypothetical protein